MSLHANSDSPVIEIHGLTRSFGRQPALADVELMVPRGGVFGLIGANGAGKTTLIKHVLGLLKAQTGSVRVFGLDPVHDPVGVLSKIGYLSEDRDLPDWMRIEELMRYTQAFYPDWDQKFADELCERFELLPSQRIKTLSRGQRARAGLLVALAHRPELLLLDEPSSGLDPVVRRDILAAIIRTVADEGRTVLFSSHLLDEVSRVADRLAMVHQGRIVLNGTLDDVQRSHRRVTLHFDQPQQLAPVLPGALWCEGTGREWTFLCNGGLDELKQAARELGARVVEEAEPSLDEIFVSRTRLNASRQGAVQ
jgi:ABC-2 type transport system ATP-binding protein